MMRLAFSSFLSACLILWGCSESSPVDTDAQVSDAAADVLLSDLNPDVVMTDTRANPDSHFKTDMKITCNASLGTASISGSVQGTAIKSQYAVGLNLLSGYVVSFLDQSGACPIIANPALHKLGLVLCGKTKGTYSVGSTCTDAGLGIKTSINIPKPGKDIRATSGTVTIESIVPACGGKIKGSFAADFSGDKVSGTFEAIGCDGQKP